MIDVAPKPATTSAPTTSAPTTSPATTTVVTRRTETTGADQDRDGMTPELPVIEFVAPLPGFADQHRFALVQLDDDGVLCALRSLDDPELRFLVIPPQAFFPDYAPEVDEEAVADLEIGTVDDVLVLLIINAGESLDTTTANLAAPLLVNLVSRRAKQVILDDPTFSVAVPLLAA